MNCDEYIIKVKYLASGVLLPALHMNKVRFLSIMNYNGRCFMSVTDSFQSATTFKEDELDAILKRATKHFNDVHQVNNNVSRVMIPITKEMALVEIMMEG